MKKLIASILARLLDDALLMQARAERLIRDIDLELVTAGCSPLDAETKRVLRQSRDTRLEPVPLAELESVPSTSVHDHTTQIVV